MPDVMTDQIAIRVIEEKAAVWKANPGMSEDHIKDEVMMRLARRVAAAEADGNLMTGWADGRLGQAYDLIDAVLRENNNPETDVDQFLRAAREAVENADVELERLNR